MANSTVKDFSFRCCATSHRMLRPWMFLCLMFLVGCNTSTENETSSASIKPATKSEPHDAATNSSGRLNGKIKFKNASGETAFSIKPKDDGAKLVDGNERELARFNVSGSKMKVKDSNDEILGYVIASGNKFKIESATDGVVLWKLQRGDNGDWKLENGQEELSNKIQQRAYGFEIEDPNDQELFKVKLKDGKTSLRDASDQTVYYTKDKLPTIAVTCLGFEVIESLPLRVALMTMLIIDAKQ